MNKHSGVGLKFFIAFFFIGAVSIILNGIQMYNGSKHSIVDFTAYYLTSTRNIKKLMIEENFFFMRSRANSFSINLASLGVSELSSAFYDLDKTSKETKDFCSVINSQVTPTLKDASSVFDVKAYESYLSSRISDSGTVARCINKYVTSDKKEVMDLFIKDSFSKQYIDKVKSVEMLMNNFASTWRISDILLISPKGDIYYSHANMPDMGANVYSNPWLGKELRDAFESTVDPAYRRVRIFDFTYYFPAEFKPRMFIATPIMDKNNNYLGAAILALDIKFINNMIGGGYNWSEEGMGKTGDIFVAAMDGTLRSDKRAFISDKDNYIKELKANGVSDENIKKIEKSGTIALVINVPDIDKISDENFNYNEEHKSLSGQIIFEAFSALSINDLDWVIGVSFEEGETKTQMAAINYALMRSGIAVLLSIFVITLLLTYIFTRPIKRIQESFLKISRGDLNAKVEVKGNDELKDLADSFNMMVDKLDVHAKENERTTQLLHDEISERKVAESELTQERDFIAAVIDSEGIIVVVINDDDKIARINNSAMMMVGQRDLIGRNYTDFLSKRYRSNIEQSVEEARVKRVTQYFVTEIFTPLNKEVVVDWRISVIDDKNSPGAHFTVFMGIDATERFKVQKTLRENEEMLQAIMSRAQDAIIITDSVGAITTWNDSAEKMLGYNFSEMAGKTIIPTIIPEKYAAELSKEDSLDKIIELYAVRKNREKFPIDISVSKVNVSGRLNICYIVRDSSLRKKREEELYKALEKSKVAEKAKTNFLANMSHEIRTPLNGILGFLNLLKQTPLQDIQNEYLRIIDSSTASLIGIINEILDFSKIESGKMQLESLEFISWQEFEQIGELYAGRAFEKNIDFLISIDPQIPEILVGDPFRIRQITSNLLSNAVKFTNEHGCINFRVSLVDTNEDNCVIRISVKDNGIGIDKDNQKIIFSAFSQGDNSVTRRYGGSGLGLAICNNLVALMGSHLEVISEKDKGSEFFFNLELSFKSIKSRDLPDLSNIFIARHNCDEHDCPYIDVPNEFFPLMGCEIALFSTIDEYNALKRKPDLVFSGYNNETMPFIDWLDKNDPDMPKIYIECDKVGFVSSQKDTDLTKILTYPITMSRVIAAVMSLLKKGERLQVQHEKDVSVSFKGNVLLVEDNAINSRLAYIILSQLGVDVEIAENGQEALDKASKSSFDIIFMDIHMPVMDGVTASKLIVENEIRNKQKHTPIVALTANVIEEERQNYVNAGMNGFIAKPLMREALVNVLNDFLPDSQKIVVKSNLIALVCKKTGIPDVDVVKNVLAEFYTLSMSQIATMREAAKNDDKNLLSSMLFSIKGAALNLGLVNIVDYCLSLESKLDKLVINDCASALNNIELELIEIKSSIG